MQTYFAFRFSPLQFCPKQGVSSFWNFLFFHGLFMVASLSSNEFLEIVDGTIFWVKRWEMLRDLKHSSVLSLSEIRGKTMAEPQNLDIDVASSIS